MNNVLYLCLWYIMGYEGGGGVGFFAGMRRIMTRIKTVAKKPITRGCLYHGVFGGAFSQKSPVYPLGQEHDFPSSEGVPPFWQSIV